MVGTYLMYCSDLLYFFARYLAEALLGILTKDSSLLYLVMLHGVSHTQKLLSCSTKKSGEERGTTELDLWPNKAVSKLMCVCVLFMLHEYKDWKMFSCWGVDYEGNECNSTECPLDVIKKQQRVSMLYRFSHSWSLFLTEGWVGTLLVHLRGAVRRVACSRNNKRTNEGFLSPSLKCITLLLW